MLTTNSIRLFFTLIVTSYSSILFGQTPCVNGTAGAYPCDKVDLLGFLSTQDMGGTSSTESLDIWGWTDPLNGKEYAIVGLSNGTSFVDISNPSSPIYLGHLPTASINSAWRDVKVHNDYAFIVSEAGSHGVQSFDLTQLRNISNPPLSLSATSTFSNIGGGNAHNLVIAEGTDHMVVVGGSGTGGCSGGLLFIDISDPTNMSLDGCFSADGYTHDAQCFIYRGPDTEHYGKQICIASNVDTQTIIDATDKSNMVQLSRTGYVESRYTHQGWVTDDHKYLLFDDEGDENGLGYNTRTHMMDISDLDNPIYLGKYTATTRAIDHNQYVKGQYTYQGNYRAGFRMLDVQDVANGNLSEVAFFDTYPQNDNANFNSAWSVYPYYDSGIVTISDIEKGLFIVRPRIPHFVMESNKEPLMACAGEELIFDIDLTSYDGYSDMVDLSVLGLPSGAIATFGSTSIGPDASTTLTISNTDGLDGAYSIIIQARGPSNNSVGDFSVSFKIEEASMASIPMIPANNAVNVDPGASFSWSAIMDVNNYKIDIANDMDFNTIIQSADDVTTNMYTPDPILPFDQELFWRVSYTSSCGAEVSSNVFSFTTDCTSSFDPIRWFVDETADPNGEGTSWNCAFDDLQDAISVSTENDEIWVAQGTYYTTDGSNRFISFILRNKVSIYGGFSGGETSKAERDWVANPTIMSGDIGVIGDASDNSYHVINNKRVNDSAVLDGFTISGGNANLADQNPSDKGGGMYNTLSSPTLNNCTFTNNIAIKGGAIYSQASDTNLNNCNFSNNISTAGEGSNLFIDNSTFRLDQVDIDDQSSTAIYIEGINSFLEIKGNVVLKKQ